MWEWRAANRPSGPLSSRTRGWSPTTSCTFILEHRVVRPHSWVASRPKDSCTTICPVPVSLRTKDSIPRKSFCSAACACTVTEGFASMRKWCRFSARWFRP